MKHRVIPRQYSVHIYDDTNDVDYISSFQVCVCGDKGIVHGITGSGFYSYWKNEESLKDLFKQLNVISLEGYMTEAHCRLIKRALKESVDVTIIGTGNITGTDLPSMRWVTVQLRSTN